MLSAAVVSLFWECFGVGWSLIACSFERSLCFTVDLWRGCVRDSANDECENRYMATATTGATILFPDEAFNPEATLLAVSLPLTQYAISPFLQTRILMWRPLEAVTDFEMFRYKRRKLQLYMELQPCSSPSWNYSLMAQVSPPLHTELGITLFHRQFHFIIST